MISDAERIAAVALAEDGEIDLTTGLTVPANLDGEGRLEYRSGGVVAGAAFADAVARACDCRIDWRAPDARVVAAGAVIGIVRGRLSRILRAERPILNLLQRACGIAYATRAYVQAVAGTRCRILHTRKTAPGLRALDVSAVLAGGGTRHRWISAMRSWSRTTTGRRSGLAGTAWPRPWRTPGREGSHPFRSRSSRLSSWSRPVRPARPGC